MISLISSEFKKTISFCDHIIADKLKYFILQNILLKYFALISSFCQTL